MILRVLEKATPDAYNYEVIELQLDGGIAGTYQYKVIHCNDTLIRVSDSIFFEINDGMCGWRSLSKEEGWQYINDYNALRATKKWPSLSFNRSEIQMEKKNHDGSTCIR